MENNSVRNDSNASLFTIRQAGPVETIINVSLLAVSILAVFGLYKTRSCGFSRSIAVVSGLNLAIALSGAANKGHASQASVDYSVPISGGVLGMAGLLPASGVAWFVIAPFVAKQASLLCFSCFNEEK